MDPVDRICANLCMISQDIGRYFDDPWLIMVIGAVVLAISLVLLRHNH